MPRYTQEQKTEAVALADKHGPAEASRQTGIPRRTISSWRTTTAQATIQKTQAARDTLKAQNETKREQLRQLLLDKAVLFADSLTPGDKAVRTDATALGILIDKYRLEMGEATGRTENIDLASAESRIDQEIQRLAEELNDPR